MRSRYVIAILLVVLVLYIFVSPFVASPKTALRAQQFATAFFYMMTILATMLSALVAPALVCEEVYSFIEPNPQSDPLTVTCLLRV